MERLHTSFFVIIISTVVFAQPPWPKPREVWSTPVQLLPDSVSEVEWSRSISVTWSGDTLLYGGVNLFYIIRSGTTWSTPKLFNAAYGIPAYQPVQPLLSPDGDMLYFTDIHSQKMYRCRKNPQTKEWGMPETFFDNGFNTGGVTWEAYNFINDTSMYIYGGNYMRLASYSAASQLWSPGPAFPLDRVSNVSEGIFLIANKKTLYKGGVLEDILKMPLSDEGVITAYFTLNLCYESDSLYSLGMYQGNKERYPTLTHDGKRMFFWANYTGIFRLYTSRLLIDENGDSVLTGTETLPVQERVNQPPRLWLYPNPFSGATRLQIEGAENTGAEVIIYDMLGREREVLPESQILPGSKTCSYRPAHLPAGVYLAVLKTAAATSAVKFVYLR